MANASEVTDVALKLQRFQIPPYKTLPLVTQGNRILSSSRDRSKSFRRPLEAHEHSGESYARSLAK
jgi:hypothetical protein